MNPKEELTVNLPDFSRDLAFPLSRAIAIRRSLRAFASNTIPLSHIAQMLWAAQGISDPDGKRTCPSAGGIFPMIVRLVAGDIGGLAPGIYQYQPGHHSLLLQTNGDIRRELASLCVDQTWIEQAAAAIVVSADPEKMTKKYGAFAARYLAMEAGHIGQNVHLIAEALGMGVTMVAAFKVKPLCELLAIPPGEDLFYVMPFGEKPS